MFREEHFTHILIFLWVIHSVFADDCPYTECPCPGGDIMCQDLGLPAIPPLTDANTGFYSLQMEGNHITTIPADSLPSGLTSITLSDNPIASIDDAAFNGSATTLNSLTLSQATFSRIPNAFLCLQNLKYLNIYDTKILDWNEGAMKIIGTNLLTLDLQNVGLTSWPDWIKYFSKLEELTLDTSMISLVPDNALDMLAANLSGLSISNGNLTSVPLTVSKLVALQSLHLHANKISNLTWLPQAKQLVTLSLNRNNIFDADELSRTLRPYGDSLQSLEIQENRLTEIPDLSFLKNIESLDLSHNQISESNSASLPPEIYELNLSYNLLPYVPTVTGNLTNTFSLILSYNIIQEIRGSDFHPMITEADLAYNQIRELTDTSFPLNFGIVMLYLNNNPITTVSRWAFDNIRSLTMLNLANTKLSRLPLALDSLNSLYALDMRGCSQLVCTCLEKSLSSRIMTIGSLLGECGETDIYNFFYLFSSACPT